MEMNDESIFAAAMEKKTSEERAAFLEEACADNPELRKNVESLLEAYGEGEFLESPAHGLAATVDRPPAEQVGTYIGPYKLVEEIGVGGMGSVFMATQKEPVRRKVALKVIKPGMDSRQVVNRFEAERQALAMMDHPNIARVFDGGATESGRPYFVMELVKGIPITDYCDRYRVTTNDRLELFGDVCRAVQHAHQKGIIHRDLKPSNILVTLLDGRAIPKIIDFGIAKATSGHLTDESLVTAFSQMVGTPMYMSPEQADLSATDVDTRSDVYSLGVLLYELLTGTTPFDRERMKEVSYDELRRIIREEEPPRPSTRLSTLDAALDTLADKHQTDPRKLSQQVNGELDWIVMKSLEKDRTRRYESANELAKDIRRYLDDEAVEACPPSTACRLRKFTRRNKATMATLASVALALILGAGIATGQAVRATKAERLAKRQERLAVKQKQLAEEAAERETKLRAEAVRQREYAESMLLLALQDFNPVGATFGPDGNFYVSSYGTSRVLRFDGSTGEFLSEFIAAGSGGLDHPEGLVFGPDANGDGTDDLYVANGNRNSVLQYDGATGVLLGTFVSVGSGGLRRPMGLTFGPDDNLYVMSYNSDSILRYDATDGRFLDEFVPARSGGLRRPQMAAFGPDGNLYVASSNTDSILRYDGTSGDFIDMFVTYDRKRLVGSINKSPTVQRDIIRAYLQVAGTQQRMGSNKEAERTIGQVVEIQEKLVAEDPTSLKYQDGLADAYSRLGNLQEATGGPDAAITVLSELIEQDPDDGVLYAGRARVYAEKGDTVKALVDYCKAIEIDPENADAYQLRARCYRIRGEFDLAIADYEQAIRRSLAQTNESSSMSTDTRASATSMNSRWPAYCRYELGDCLYAAGQTVRAADAFRKAHHHAAGLIELMPSSAGERRLLVNLLGACPIPELRDPDRALELVKTASELDPNTTNSLKSLGLAYYRHGDWQAAAETLERWWEREDSPVKRHYGFVLAMAYWRLDRKEDARRTYHEFVELVEGVQLEGPMSSRRFSEEAAQLFQLHYTPAEARRSGCA